MSASCSLQIAGTDFFPYSDAVSVLQKHPELLAGLGKLTAVHGVCSEPGGIESGRDWLLDINHAGSGLMDDQVPHPASMIDVVLHKHFKASLTDADIRNMHTSRLQDPLGTNDEAKRLEEAVNQRHPDNGSLETAGTINALLQVPDHGEVEVILSFGKGIGGRPGGHLPGKDANVRDEQVAYGMELIFEEGRVELSTGADNNFSPYVIRVPKNVQEPVQVYEVQGGKLGYTQMVLDWVLVAQGELREMFIEVSSSALNSIRFLQKAHEFMRAKGIKPDTYTLGEVLKFGFAYAFTNPLIETKSVGSHEGTWESHKRK